MLLMVVTMHQAVRDLGSELGITVIDSLNNTKSLYDTVGVGTAPKDAENGDSETVAPTGSAALHATDQGLVVDNTHLNEYGASMVAYMMAKDIQASNTSLASHVANLTEPTVDMLTRMLIGLSLTKVFGIDQNQQFGNFLLHGKLWHLVQA